MIDLVVRLHDGPGRLVGSAMVDTGSAFTIFSRQDLIAHRFSTLNAKKFKPGFEGVGGNVAAWYLENAKVSVQDTNNAYHHVNVPRLFFYRFKYPADFRT